MYLPVYAYTTINYYYYYAPVLCIYKYYLNKFELVHGDDN